MPSPLEAAHILDAKFPENATRLRHLLSRLDAMETVIRGFDRQGCHEEAKAMSRKRDDLAKLAGLNEKNGKVIFRESMKLRAPPSKPCAFAQEG